MNREPDLRGLVAGVFGLFCFLALPACHPSGIDMSDTPQASEPTNSAAKSSAEYKNPQPKQAYRVTMTIKNAPGTFAWMRPIAHYDVTNRECLSPPKDNPGGLSAPTPTAPTDFELKQTSEGVYTGVVYADLMIDKDYTGNGVCHWELTSIVVQMKATGAQGETLFTPNISYEHLVPGGNETVYFNKISYPGHDEPSDTLVAHPGLSDRSRFGPSIQDSDLFTVAFAITKEGAP